MKLYIIGNGFDLHHRLPTSYENYKQFLSNTHPGIISQSESFQYIRMHDLVENKWSDLENNLTLNYKIFLDDYISDLIDYAPHGNIDDVWGEFELELKALLGFIYDFTGKYFLEWLDTIDVKRARVDNALEIDNTGLFLTFNYTNTLETIYNISNERILHIHGTHDRVDHSLIFGDAFYLRSRTIEEAEITEPIPLFQIDNNTIRKEIQFGSINNNPDIIRKELQYNYSYDADYGPYIRKGINELIDFGEAYFKNLKSNYEKLESFLNDNPISEIMIMGHSFDSVDEQYYSEVLIPKYINCKWVFFYRSSSASSKEKAIKFINKYNIKSYELLQW